MKRFWFAPFICAIFMVSALQAQLPQIDSIRKLAETKSGKDKIDALNALSLRLLLIDYTLAKSSIEQAFTLSEQTQYFHGLAEATIHKGVLEDIDGNTKVSLQRFAQALQNARNANDSKTEGYALTRIANVYRDLGNYDSARYWYDEAIQALTGNSDTWQLSILYRNLSVYYSLIYKTNNEIEYLHRALQIRQKLADGVLLLDVYLLLTKLYIKEFNLPLAEKYLQEVKKYSGSGTSTAAHNEIKYYAAIINFRKNNYEEGIIQLKEIKQFYSKHGNLQQYANLLIDLAEVLEEMSSYELSLKMGYEALKICEKNKFLMESARAQLIIGRNYMRLNQSSVALEFTNKALATAHTNSFRFLEGSAYNLIGLTTQSIDPKEALHAYEKAYSIRKSIGDQAGMAYSLGNIGECYEEIDQFETALEVQKKSESIAETASVHTALYWAYYNMSKVYFRQHKYAKADELLKKAERKTKEINYPLAFMYNYPLRRNLLMAQGKLQEALKYSLLYEQLKDSLNYNSITGRVLGIQSVYEQERKDYEISLLNKNKEVQQQQIENQKLKLRSQEYILGLGILALILTGSWAYTANRSFKKTALLNFQIKEQNEEIQAQSEELIETNQALLETNRDLGEKHEEMQTQSEELRESHLIISQLNEGLEKNVEDRTKQLQQAYKELDMFFYRSSHDFRRPLTTFMGLAEVAKITVKDPNALDLFDKVKETAVNLDRMLIKLQSISDIGAQQFVYKELSLKQVFESTLDTYREGINDRKIKTTIEISPITNFSSYPAFLKIILDNLVENAIQFCGRTGPYIKLIAHERNGDVVITIKDNGVGVEEEYKDRLFDMFFRGNELSKGNGLGLYIVQKALEKLNGSLTFESTIGTGTTFIITLPSSQPGR